MVGKTCENCKSFVLRGFGQPGMLESGCLEYGKLSPSGQVIPTFDPLYKALANFCYKYKLDVTAPVEERFNK